MIYLFDFYIVKFFHYNLLWNYWSHLLPWGHLYCIVFSLWFDLKIIIISIHYREFIFPCVKFELRYSPFQNNRFLLILNFLKRNYFEIATKCHKSFYCLRNYTLQADIYWSNLSFLFLSFFFGLTVFFIFLFFLFLFFFFLFFYFFNFLIS